MDDRDFVSPETAQKGIEKAGLRSGWTRASFLKRAGLVGLGTGVGGVVLAACGSSNGTTTAGATDATTTATPGGGGSVNPKLKNKTVGIVHLTEADENEGALAKAFEQAAEEAGLNWTVKQSDSQASQAKAEQAFAAYVNQGVDAVIPLVVSAQLVEAQLAQAKEKSIPVFGMWTFSELNPLLVVDNTPPPAADAANLAAYMFGDLYIRKPDGQIKVALLDTDLEVLQARSKCVRALAELYPRIEIVDAANINLEDINGSTSTAVQGFLSKTDDLDGIWTNYPPTGPGAAAAVEQRGKTDQCGVYAHVAEGAGLEALKNPNGALRATSWVDIDAQSYNLVELMLQYFNGEEVQRLAGKETIAPDKIITHHNVGEAEGQGTAAGYGWTHQFGTWKPQLIAEWKERFK